MKGIPTQVVLRPDQAPKLEKLGEAMGVNRSVLVRWAIDDLIEKNLSKITPECNMPTSVNTAVSEAN
jgi:hypothetical protein